MSFELIPYSSTDYEPLILPDGFLSFPGGERRSQRVALVAGDTYLHDGGFYDTDREATLTGTVTLAQAQMVDQWLRNNIALYFDDSIGVYKCSIKSVGPVDDKLKISIVLYITEKLVSTADIVYPPAPADPWVDRTDNTFWTGFNFSWTGSGWFTNTFRSPAYLAPSGGWEVGYRPSKVRFQLTSNGVSMEYSYIASGAGNLFFEVGKPVQDFEYDLVNTGADITDLGVRYEDVFPELTITKIEFSTE